MKSCSSVRVTRVPTLTALGCILSLFLSGSVALSQPFPSFILDTTIVNGPAAGRARRTRVAAGGGVCLFVWVDVIEVCGARTGLDGRLLDSLPLEIDGPDFDAIDNVRPQVAWSGRNFLVAWSSIEQTMFALVETSGHVTLRRLLQDSTRVWQNSGIGVGFDGVNFLIAWSVIVDEVQDRAYFSRVSPDGVVLDSPPRLIAPADSGPQSSVAVCFNQDRYFVATVRPKATNELWGSFVLPDGSTPDSSGFPIRTGVETAWPNISHNGRNFVVSWLESGHETRAARVTNYGAVLDTAGVLIDSFSNGAGDVFSVGDTTVVALCRDSLWYGDSLVVLAVRLDTALRRIDTSAKVLSSPEPGAGDNLYPRDPSIALAGNDFFVAWCKPFSVGDIVYGEGAALRRVSRDWQLLDSAPMVLSRGNNGHTYPDVAADGTNLLAVWVDWRHDSIARSEAVWGMRFSPGGVRLDPVGFQISPPGATRPALAFGGGCYLVCWAHDYDIYGARVFPDGRLADSVPIPIEDSGTWSAYTPDVAFGDSTFLVVWRANSMVYGVRVTPDGVVADTAPRLMQSNAYPARYPQVGFDGHDFLVVRNRDGDDFMAARVSTGGDLLDTTDIVFGKPYSSSSVPRVAFGDGVYMVVDSRGHEIWRISRDGVVLDSAIPTAGSRFSVTFDGTDFMLACDGDTSTELGGLRIAPDGRVLDSLPFVLTATQSSTVSSYQHALTTNDAGKVAAVFSASEPAPYCAGRIRAVTFPAIIGIGSERGNRSPSAFRALPNPASGRVSLSFGLKQAGPAQISAFDATGRRCAVVHSGRMAAGTHSLAFDTRPLANGVYFLRFEAGAEHGSARLVVAR